MHAYEPLREINRYFEVQYTFLKCVTAMWQILARVRQKIQRLQHNKESVT